MKIIFLDFDGVMDTAFYDSYLVKHHLPEVDSVGRPVFDPSCIANLKSIIDTTGADVVVTSDWKYLDTYEQLLKMWEERSIPGFMTDTTPNVSKHRGDEIDQWLKECKEDCCYVIIDDLDDSNFNKHQLNHLVTVNPYNGLDELCAKQAIAILQNPLNYKHKLLVTMKRKKCFSGLTGLLRK